MLVLANLLLLISTASHAFKDLDYFRKMVKSHPTISNSLVNLGRIDVSVFLPNKRDAPMQQPPEINPLRKLIFTAFREMSPPPHYEHHGDEALSPHPDVFKKIFLNNDLFSMGNMEGCCGEHQQNTITFEHQKPELIFIPKPRTIHKVVEAKSPFKKEDLRVVADRTEGNNANSMKAVDEKTFPSNIQKSVKSNEVNEADNIVTPKYSLFVNN